MRQLVRVLVRGIGRVSTSLQPVAVRLRCVRGLRRECRLFEWYCIISCTLPVFLKNYTFITRHEFVEPYS